MIFMHLVVFYVFNFMLRRQQMKVTYLTDEPRAQLFWLQVNPEDPQFEPHAKIKMAQVRGSPLYICALSRGYPPRNNSWFLVQGPYNIYMVKKLSAQVHINNWDSLIRK